MPSEELSEDELDWIHGVIKSGELEQTMDHVIKIYKRIEKLEKNERMTNRPSRIRRNEEKIEKLEEKVDKIDVGLIVNRELINGVIKDLKKQVLAFKPSFKGNKK